MQIFIDYMARRLDSQKLPSQKELSAALKDIETAATKGDEQTILNLLVKIQLWIFYAAIKSDLPLEHAIANVLIGKENRTPQQILDETLQGFRKGKIHLSKNPSEVIDIQICELKNRVSELEQQIAEQK